LRPLGKSPEGQRRLVIFIYIVICIVGLAGLPPVPVLWVTLTARLLVACP